MSNERGLVVELLRNHSDGTPDKFQQIVLFKGIVLERLTTSENRRKHWRSATYRTDTEVNALDVTDTGSWLGRWMDERARRGFVLLGEPFLMEANEAEATEVREGRMPRAMALRINKAREEQGTAAPWDEKGE